MQNIKILNNPTADSPFLVIYKPENLPSAPLNQDDENNALFEAIKLYPQIKNIKGKKEIEYGLLHRLDTVTRGLLLIALEQKFYDHIISEQHYNRFIKYYSAECAVQKNLPEGFPDFPFFQNYAKNASTQNAFSLTQDISAGQEFTVESYFRYYGPGNKEVRPVLKDAGGYALKKAGKLKLYKTDIKILEKNDEKLEVMCSIAQGFKHQVRAHLCWSGIPVAGDKIYNMSSRENEEFSEDFNFEACGFEFEYEGKKYFFGRK